MPKKLNKKHLLCQDILIWIKDNNEDWKEKVVMKSVKKSFINNSLNAIWYIDTCDVKKMKERAIYSLKKLKEFFNRLDLLSYKNAKPNFNYDCLNRYANLLFRYLNIP